MPKDLFVGLPAQKIDLAFEGKVWDVVTEHFDFAGESLARDFIRHTGAVAVIALNEKREVLLIRQYRRPVDSYLWELPAGLLDVEGESLEVAAARELLEETDYVAKNLEQLITFYTSPGGSSESIAIFMATELEKVTNEYVRTAEETDLQPTWVPIEDAIKSVMLSEMKNPAAMVGIFALARKLGL